MFGAPPPGAAPLLSMKAGKMTMEGSTVTADPRKGLLVLRKAEDGLMHLIWKDRDNGGAVVDDLIVFEGDATMRHVEECNDGFAMLLEFSQTARKLFFYSQEPRKKGLGWASDETVKERELLEKANNVLTGGQAAAPASAAGGAGAVAGGALGMTHSELMAMLGSAAPQNPASAETPAGGAPAAAADTPASAAPAGAAAFSADSIANILGNIQPAGGAAPATPAAGGGAFSADAISNILGNIQAGGAAGGQPLGIGEVLSAENAASSVDATMEVALNEHLPQGGSIAESAAETLSTPQMAQVRHESEPARGEGEGHGSARTNASLSFLTPHPPFFFCPLSLAPRRRPASPRL